jgi:hypothetical protein
MTTQHAIGYGDTWFCLQPGQTVDIGGAVVEYLYRQSVAWSFPGHVGYRTAVKQTRMPRRAGGFTSRPERDRYSRPSLTWSPH